MVILAYEVESAARFEYNETHVHTFCPCSECVCGIHMAGVQSSHTEPKKGKVQQQSHCGFFLLWPLFFADQDWVLQPLLFTELRALCKVCQLAWICRDTGEAEHQVGLELSVNTQQRWVPYVLDLQEYLAEQPAFIFAFEVSRCKLECFQEEDSWNKKSLSFMERILMLN